jgi:hypothetical protein
VRALLPASATLLYPNPPPLGAGECFTVAQFAESECKLFRVGQQRVLGQVVSVPEVCASSSPCARRRRALPAPLVRARGARFQLPLCAPEARAPSSPCARRRYALPAPLVRAGGARFQLPLCAPEARAPSSPCARRRYALPAPLVRAGGVRSQLPLCAPEAHAPSARRGMSAFAYRGGALTTTMSG